MLLVDLIIFFFNSLSPYGVRAVHRSQFQATFTLWSKANNFHYSLVRLPPRHRRPPSSNIHNSLTPGSVTTVGGAEPSPVGLL